jgi:hypothetical protein
MTDPSPATPAASATPPAEASLHLNIMNLPTRNPYGSDRERRAYFVGHRDARHDAAELASQALAPAPVAPPATGPQLEPVDAFPNAPGLSAHLGLHRATTLPPLHKDGLRWFSVCSAHQTPTEGCERCLVGTYGYEVAPAAPVAPPAAGTPEQPIGGGDCARGLSARKQGSSPFPAALAAPATLPHDGAPAGTEDAKENS